MIRIANLNDSETIIKFNYLLALETEGLNIDKKQLSKGVREILSDSNKGFYFVYEEDNQVIGQLMITREWSDWRCAYFAWIQSVYVDKNHRKKHVFRSLFDYVQKMVKDDPNYCGIRLYTDKNNLVAQSTYKKLGMNESNYIFYELEK
jgi:ribosomal protein S18 acetylase RimI-like enzyme